MKFDKARVADRAYGLNLAHSRIATDLCPACGNLNADGRCLWEQCHWRQQGYDQAYSGSIGGIVTRAKQSGGRRRSLEDFEEAYQASRLQSGGGNLFRFRAGAAE